MVPHPPPLLIVFDARPAEGIEPAWAKRLAQALRQAGRDHELFLLRDLADLGYLAGRAVHAARAAGAAVVVVAAPVVLNAVLQVVWNAKLALGILPQPPALQPDIGGGPARRFDTAVDALLRAQIEEIQLGQLGDTVFLSQAEVGLLPAAAGSAAPHPRRGGDDRRSALQSNLATLLGGRSLLTLELQAQGRTRVVRARTIRVRCNQLRALDEGPDPDAGPSIEPGQLIATAWRPAPPLRTLWRALSGGVGGGASAQAVDRFAFERLLVRPPRGRGVLTVRFDGVSVAMAAPLRFQPAPSPLRLLRAAGSAARGS